MRCNYCNRENLIQADCKNTRDMEVGDSTCKATLVGLGGGELSMTALKKLLENSCTVALDSQIVDLYITFSPGTTREVAVSYLSQNFNMEVSRWHLLDKYVTNKIKAEKLEIVRKTFKEIADNVISNMEKEQ